jgi:prophage maintenance system killer protein
MDGNKPLAFAAMDVLLRLNGVVRVPPEDAMYQLVIEVAAGELKGVAEIAERLRELFHPDLA